MRWRHCSPSLERLERHLLPAAAAAQIAKDLKNYKTDDKVAALFSNSGNTTTYTFFSSNENPVNGVPGLVKYCVYYTPKVKAPTIDVLATGANGALWLSRQDPSDFAFVLPGGDKSNIPLDGKTITMGTATWTDVPTTQTILLHINDPKVCASIYGGTVPTCFVFPGTELLEESCVIGDGVDTAAYNAIPFGAENCIPPSFGVEAYGFNELGDEVQLAGTARKLVSLNVLFTSYGCSVSGHWYSGDCSTTDGATFDVPITANIYDSSACSGTPVVCLGTPLATVTTTQTIPYRPSADPANCPDGNPLYTAGSQWFNSLGNGGAGACQYSIAKLLTFDFSSQNITLPDNVIWTVAYNTSHSGYHPIAIPLGLGDSCESSAGGCGYDSLNVGTLSYDNSPYAGTDVDEAVVFLSWWAGTGVPTSYPFPFGDGVLTPPVGIESTTDTLMPSTTTDPTPWIGLRPLGEIITQ